MDRRQFSKTVVKTTLGAGLIMASPMGLYLDHGSRIRILGLAGSPRKQGNTDTLLSVLLKAAQEEGAETEKIYLKDHHVKPCVLCEQCHQNGQKSCVLKDDFQLVVEKMVAADVIVISSPVHWIAVTTNVKLIMDRGYSLLKDSFKNVMVLGNSLLKGKIGAMVVCCNSKDIKTYAEPVANSIHLFYKFLGIELAGTILASAGFIEGEVTQNEIAMNQAVELGKKLAHSL